MSVIIGIRKNNINNKNSYYMEKGMVPILVGYLN